MTEQEFNKLNPGKTLLKTTIDGVEKIVLFKFFICNKDDFDGYSLCVTEDLSNPYPSQVVKEDIETYFNLCEIKQCKEVI